MNLMMSYWMMFIYACQTLTTNPVIGDLIIFPMPASMKTEQGYFIIDEKTRIQTDSFSSPTFDAYKVFEEVFKRKSGYSIPMSAANSNQADTKHLILIIRSPEKDNNEGYHLEVTPDGISISASTEQGLFYAFQTLRQIMKLDVLTDASGIKRTWAVPSVEIQDRPAFSYRGLHLDVCRHFMQVSFVKKYIDLLAYYKMNRFHWHLTDDQGWRIEIKKYPKLQEVGAWRKETLIGHYNDQPVRYDGTRYGGYYTQEEIRDVVAYANDRGVTIIPEIEMPGHSLAALASYPELACTPGPFTVATTWGVFEDVLCPSEATFTFLQNVLDEVIELFPSPYIHIGGDECPKTRWKESAFCQQLIKKEDLKDENGLQSYFIRRIEKYINQKGRKIIGWDEILEGGLAPNATVMSWRGMSGGIEAARSGHDVVMTPGSYCYFDYYQADPAHEPLAIGGMITLEKVYSFNPVPGELTAEEAKHILGAQANLWTEYIATPDKVEYMVYPRAIALAEVLWTSAPKKDWNDFIKRLSQHGERLEGMDVHSAHHLTDPNTAVISNEAGLRLIWKTDLPRQTIFYTRDTTLSEWSKAISQDTTLFETAGTIFYRTEHSPVKQLNFFPSKLKGAVLSSLPMPDERYPGIQGLATLSNGLDGSERFNGQDWCGWEGKVVRLDIDFKKTIAVDSVIVGILSSPGSWIYSPESIELESSTDQVTYQKVDSWSIQNQVPGHHDIAFKVPESPFRYLRLKISPLMKIPAGKPGAGHGAWTFLDEIRVY